MKSRFYEGTIVERKKAGVITHPGIVVMHGHQLMVIHNTPFSGGVIDHQSSVRAAPLFSKSIRKVIVKRGSLVIQIDAAALRDVISENLKLGLPKISSE